ncbi:unnamed protein product [Oikopleura dioica]|uniref:Coatomer subunit zeta n=1 Tax=Oikopleura dioica TaxID=34765 RepID=E4XXZ0_OIKDI|nr:unnamed protein product [Oikopleura dioica]
MEPSLYTIDGIIILDNDGKRLIGKYYQNSTMSLKEQKAFEKKIFEKTKKRDDEILLLDGVTICYKSNVDLIFYVVGNSEENELLLAAVLNCVYDAISLILRKNVEKRALYHHLENVFLAIDEIIDDGIIMEIDPNNVYNRLAIRSEDIPLSETNLSQFLERAKEEVKWSFFK